MRAVLRLFALLTVSSLAFGAAPPFAHEASDLAPDPQARYGKLPNGLRYVVRANREPRDRASFRLLVNAGAVHETENQLGLAHFLEHLAFNGTEHYPPGTLIEFFQRMGMNFGGDTNASTWFTRTLYLIELPDTKAPTLAEGLKVFRDYAGGMLLNETEIEKERGIILSEKRSRDSVGQRTWLATNNFYTAGTMFARRDVIGTDQSLRTMPRAEFVDYYRTWYRPERMAVVAVGDFDPAAVEAQIIAAFGDFKAAAPARPEPALGRVAHADGVHPFVHLEPEAPSTGVTLATVLPYQAEPDTGANRLKYLPRQLAHAIVNRRLSILAKQEGAPFTSGSAGAGEAYDTYRQTSLSLTCRADQWTAALGVAEQELRRALTHGFQPAELAEIVANFRNSLRQAVTRAPTRRSDAIADEFAEALLEDDVVTTAEADLALYGPALEKITVDDCVAALREAWSPRHRLVVVTGNAQLPAGDAGRELVGRTYAASLAVPVAAPAAIAEAVWAYTDFGPAGKIAKRESIADLGITLLTFANGVRLNLKPTDFQANRILTSLRIGSGQLTEPRDRPGLAFYAGRIYNEGGLGRHSADELRRVLAGRTVGANFGIDADAFTVGGSTNRADLLLQLQLTTARLTDPGFRPEAARQVRKAIDQIYLSFEHTAAGPFNLEVQRLLRSGDPRFGLPPKEEMLRRTPEEAKAWILPQLADGALEVALVGDFDPEAAIDAVARTLGTLPPRAPRPALDELRRVRFPAEPFVRDFTVATEIPKGEVAIFWPTTDGRDIRRARRLNMLGAVFSDRLRVKVREELGDAYSPGAGSSAGDLYPEYGFMQAGVTVDPPRARQVADIIVGIAADLAKDGVTADELERARKPVLTSLRESARTNGYWLGNVLSRAQEKPEVLDWCRNRYADNEAITAEELSALARAYFGADRASRVTILPSGKKSE